MKINAKRAARFVCASLAALGLSTNALANFWCSGKVSYLGLNSEGFVYVAVTGFGVWHMCSQTTSFAANGGNTFSPEGCRALYATLLAAKAAEQTVSFAFVSSASSSNGAECTALGSWTYPNPAPYHFSVN